jgi:type IV secretion system protein VirB5
MAVEEQHFHLSQCPIFRDQLSTLPFVDVEVKNVVLDDLRQSPYSARIEFEKVFTNPLDHTEIKRERWTASVTYVFRESVKNNGMRMTNAPVNSR